MQETTKTLEIGFAIPQNADLSALNAANLQLQLPQHNDLKNYIRINSLETDSDVSLFSSKEDVKGLMQHIQSRLKLLFAPLRTSIGTSRTLLAIIAYSFLAIPFLFYFGWMFIRGWRLDIVRRVGLGEEIINYVPDLQPLSVLRYLKKGFVLMLMRGIYFLPHFIFIALTSNRLLGILVQIFWWLWEKFWSGKDQSFINYILQILPEIFFDILLQLVILALYMVVVWPIYRITMIKYALGIIRGYDFLNPHVIKDSIHIYRKEAGLVLGIYFWTFVVEFALGIVSRIISIITLGFGRFFITPGINLVFKHWPISFGYGVLARKLLEKGHIKLKSQQQLESNLV